MSKGALGYCKLCELSDFYDPALRPVICEVSGEASEYPDYPRGREHRKWWEVGMTIRALRDLGALGEDSEILGVGAGREATMYWLTNHARRVFATDLYLADDAWTRTGSDARMIFDPSEGAGIPWNPQRLVVQHMDALELRYEDESFDGIFSSGSIEHFGSFEQIRRGVEEMYRVLKPGGVAGISTEFRVSGPGPGFPGTVMFDESELRSVVLDGIGWEPASSLDLSIAEESLATEIDWRWLFPGFGDPPKSPTLRQHIRRRLPGPLRWSPPPEQTEYRETTYPHIVMRLDDLAWTSVHLALVKPGG